MEVKRYRLKFYADHAQYKNRYFCFDLHDMQTVNRLLARFSANGNVFRMVYLTDNLYKSNVVIPEDALFVVNVAVGQGIFYDLDYLFFERKHI